MKFQYSIFLITFLLLSCITDDNNDNSFEVDDSLLSDSLKTIYLNDASRLALRDIYEKELEVENHVVIDSEIQDQYYFALVNIYNSSMLERDIVVDSWNIHTFLNPALFELILTVNGNTEWIQHWVNGDSTTGITQIDELFELYYLKIINLQSFLGNYTVLIRSTSPLNLRALAYKFENVEGVIYSEPMGYDGDGNDITCIKHSDYFEIEYHLKWGDCSAGCIEDHWWTFNVNFDGTVEFVGEFGSDLP